MELPMEMPKGKARLACNEPVPSENPPEFEIRRNKHFEAVDLLTGELVPVPKNVAIRCRTA